MDAAGNGYLVYERSDGGTQEIVGAERKPGAAGIWTVPEVLSGGLSPVKEPKVAAGPNGQAFAAWIAGGSDEVRMSVISPPTTVNPSSVSGPTAAQRAQIIKSVNKLKKKLKKAKKSKNSRLAKKIKKKIKKEKMKLIG